MIYPQQNKHKRSTFSREEDRKLQELVAKYKTDWAKIASEMPGRNSRQVKDRWENYLSADIEHRPWTSDEDSVLYEKYAKFGPRWKYISSFFEKRTEAQVKNRWRLLERAKVRRARQYNQELLWNARHLLKWQPKCHFRRAQLTKSNEVEAEAKNTYEPYDLECDTFPEDTEILEEAFLLNCEID